MDFDEEITYELAKEMAELSLECKVRCDKIEEIVKKKSKGLIYKSITSIVDINYIEFLLQSLLINNNFPN